MRAGPRNVEIDLIRRTIITRVVGGNNGFSKRNKPIKPLIRQQGCDRGGIPIGRIGGRIDCQSAYVIDHGNGDGLRVESTVPVTDLHGHFIHIVRVGIPGRLEVRSGIKDKDASATPDRKQSHVRSTNDAILQRVCRYIYICGRHCRHSSNIFTPGKGGSGPPSVSDDSRGIVDRRHRNRRRIRRRREGRRPAIGRGIHLRPFRPARLIPRPVGHRRTVGILPVRHKAQAVGATQEERTGITDRPHRRPAAPDVVLPRPVATGQGRDGDAFGRPAVHIGDRAAHDRRNQVAAVVGLILRNGRQRRAGRRQHRRIIFCYRGGIQRKFRC